MKVAGEDRRTVWSQADVVCMIDQRLLPHCIKTLRCGSIDEVCEAISDMAVRGAVAIGAVASYALAGAEMRGEDLDSVYARLLGTRPTAYDLKDALDSYMAAQGQPFDRASDYIEASVKRCRLIGEHGAGLLGDGTDILTHCNAGALGCVDWGTALAPMRVAAEQGKDVHVWACETRPRCQGARLTAWEMMQEGIRHTLIADNAAGHFMARGMVDIVIVGADRVAANGDVANKIGTYEKAVLAKENDIPFYVAAPSSTFDAGCPDGASIPIEERGPEEVTRMFGREGSVLITYEGCPAANPAFDITPKKYITGFITELGVSQDVGRAFL